MAHCRLVIQGLHLLFLLNQLTSTGAQEFCHDVSLLELTHSHHSSDEVGALVVLLDVVAPTLVSTCHLKQGSHRIESAGGSRTLSGGALATHLATILCRSCP